jgi:hypothetical protein
MLIYKNHIVKKTYFVLMKIQDMKKIMSIDNIFYKPLLENTWKERNQKGFQENLIQLQH